MKRYLVIAVLCMLLFPVSGYNLISDATTDGSIVIAEVVPLSIRQTPVTVRYSDDSVGTIIEEDIITHTEGSFEVREVDGKSVLTRTLSNGKRATVTHTPKEALSLVGQHDGCEQAYCRITLTESQSYSKPRVVYHVRARQQVRLFGIISLRAPMEADIDAERGEILLVSRPWWYNLSTT